MTENKLPLAPIFSLDRNTLVPIGLLVAVVLASISATTWIQGTLLSLEHKIDQLKERVTVLAADGGDRWTLRDQEAWADLLQARNSALIVPQPKRKP